MLKETQYQQINISKVFKIITNNHSYSQSQQQRQATEEEIRMSINLLYFEGTSEKLLSIQKQSSRGVL